MESIDPKMAARVWQRVQAAKNDGVHMAGSCAQRPQPAEQAAAVPDLRELIARLWVDAALCRHLTRHFRGSDRSVLDRIARQKQNCTMQLKGIFRMQTGTHPQIPAPPVPRGTSEQLLQLCCDGTGHCAAQLQQLSADPRYGSDFARMAGQAQQQHQQLLILLGKVNNR